MWVRPSVKVYDKFGMALKDIMVFFKTAEKTVQTNVFSKCVEMDVFMGINIDVAFVLRKCTDRLKSFFQMPLPRPPKQKKRVGEIGAQGAYFEPSVSRLVSKGNIKKSSSIQHHVPSLKPQSGYSILLTF